MTGDYDAQYLHSPGFQQASKPRVWKHDEDEKPKTVLGTQVGGSHYTDCAIQPIEYIWANKLGFSEGNIVKYVTRWRAKGGLKDLEKARHHIDLLIEYERGLQSK
jgi:hypothetical protein